jgi:hypothetical protein
MYSYGMTCKESALLLIEALIAEKKIGLWDRIRKRRAEGKRKLKPGEKGYPKADAFKKASK